MRTTTIRLLLPSLALVLASAGLAKADLYIEVYEDGNVVLQRQVVPT
jgi:hypothetical protein